MHVPRARAEIASVLAEKTRFEETGIQYRGNSAFDEPVRPLQTEREARSHPIDFSLGSSMDYRFKTSSESQSPRGYRPDYHVFIHFESHLTRVKGKLAKLPAFFVFPFM